MEELTEKDYKAIVDALIKSGDIKVVKHKNSIEVQDNDYNTLVEIKNHKS